MSLRSYATDVAIFQSLPIMEFYFYSVVTGSNPPCLVCSGGISVAEPQLWHGEQGGSLFRFLFSIRLDVIVYIYSRKRKTKDERKETDTVIIA